MKKTLIGFVIGVLFTTIILATVAVAFAKTGRDNISVEFNNIKIFVDGVEKITDNEPFTYNDRTYVPLRFIAESLDKDVNWVESTNSVYIGVMPSISAPTAEAAQPVDFSSYEGEYYYSTYPDNTLDIEINNREASGEFLYVNPSSQKMAGFEFYGVIDDDGILKANFIDYWDNPGQVTLTFKDNKIIALITYYESGSYDYRDGQQEYYKL